MMLSQMFNRLNKTQVFLLTHEVVLQADDKMQLVECVPILYTASTLTPSTA